MPDIYLRNEATGEIHRLREGHLSDERCNVDSMRTAGHAHEVSEEEALAEVAAEPDLICGHCWPVDIAVDNDTNR